MTGKEGNQPSSSGSFAAGCRERLPSHERELLIKMALVLLQLTTLAHLAVVDAVLTFQRLAFSAGAP